MRELIDMVCGKRLKPYQKKVSMLDSSSELITTFDFESICFSLLIDETIMKDKNYTFINDDPRIFKQTNKQTIKRLHVLKMAQFIKKLLPVYAKNQKIFV